MPDPLLVRGEGQMGSAGEPVLHDVLLVGGGGAGLRAAIAVAEAAPERGAPVS